MLKLDEIRQQFPITRHYNFMNHAAVAPLCRPAAEAMAGFAREVCENAYLKGTYYRAADRVRRLAAKLIGATPEEVTFVKNTTEGVNYVANGIQWVSGDNVVSLATEFPANVYPWLNLQSRGVQLRRVQPEATASRSTASPPPSTAGRACWRFRRCSGTTGSGWT